MLGVFEAFQYQTRTVEIKRGEGVLLYTDGVTDASDKNGEFFEESRLEAYLAANGGQPIDELVLRLHAELERFTGGAPRADDITILAVRRKD